jgi:hypothetical protein
LLRRTDDPAHRTLALDALRRNGERRTVQCSELPRRDRDGWDRVGRGRGARTAAPVRAEAWAGERVREVG